VEHVVNPLGNGKELVDLGRRGDHGPADVGAAAARVCDQRAEHLGNAAAGGGRVHVPDRAPAQSRDAFRYRLTRQTEKGPQTVEVHEDAVPQAVRACVVDELA